MTAVSLQLCLDLRPDRAACPHRICFVTMAYVPAGIACAACGLLILQYLPEPPERLGYSSADWAWHHRDSKPWTTQNTKLRHGCPK